VKRGVALAALAINYSAHLDVGVADSVAFVRLIFNSTATQSSVRFHFLYYMCSAEMYVIKRIKNLKLGTLFGFQVQR
jgi:hypothetical protein